MTKKLFFTLLTTSALFFAACNNTKDEKSTTKEEEKTSKEDSKTSDDDDDSGPSGDIKKASAELCDCFNKHMPDIDPAVENIIMKAANSDNPMQTMQNEFMKIENEAERNRLTEKFENLDKDKEMEECGNKIKAKYNLKEKDKATERQIMMALEGNSDCPLLAAMGKMAMKMEAQMKETMEKNSGQ